jgi:hypothetical protein
MFCIVGGQMMIGMIGEGRSDASQEVNINSIPGRTKKATREICNESKNKKAITKNEELVWY